MFTPEEKCEIIDGHLAEISSAKGMASTLEDQASHLDEVLSEAYSNADNLFDRVNLIDKFESGYPELLRVSNWYRSNLEEFSDQKREHDELTCILDKLKRSSPEDNFDWRKLAAQFRVVLGRPETYSTPGPESGDQLWYVKRSLEVRQPNEMLVKRGLKALGFPNGSKGLEGWHSLLRLHSSLSRRRLDKESYAHKQSDLVYWRKVAPLCTASAEFCDSLAARAQGNGRGNDSPLADINRLWERRFKARPLLQYGTPSAGRGHQGSLFSDLNPAKRQAHLAAGSNSASNPSQRHNGRIKEDSLAKLESIEERLEAIDAKLTQEREPVKAKRIPKSYPKDFEGLPDKPVSPYLASAPLTEMQFKCARLRWDYCLTVTEVAGRLRKPRATVQEHLNAARRKMDNTRSNARANKRIRTPRERSQ